MKSYVSMEQKICFICTKEFDTGAILLDKRLKESMESKTTTGVGTCPECGNMKKTHIALIGATPKRDNMPEIAKENDVKRSGVIVWIKRDFFTTFFNIEIPAQGICYVDTAVILALSTAKERSN